MSKEYLEQWTVPSSDGKREYTISLTLDGKFECSCPDWINRRQQKGEHCKHIRMVVASEQLSLVGM